MIIDLRSDTVTKPSAAMREAMMNAEVGDDVFAEDPTIKRLEEKVSAMFGMESGLFCPSGTMTNQIAIKCHTQPLDEIICDKLCHIYNYETGGWAFHSGVSIRLTNGDNGRMTVLQIEELIQPDVDWLPNTSMVAIENTVNKGGGSIYSIDEMKAISEFCKGKDLKLHMDGARIFNALVELKAPPERLTGMFDSISICISKGLGAPVGSVLIGNQPFIKKARKVRKVMGGGMRQAGILAAACIYALENHIDRLKDDHQRAKILADKLAGTAFVKQVLPVKTNIVIFEVADSALVARRLSEQNICVQPFSPTLVRMVTHLDFTEEMLSHVIAVLDTIKI